MYEIYRKFKSLREKENWKTNENPLAIHLLTLILYHAQETTLLLAEKHLHKSERFY